MWLICIGVDDCFGRCVSIFSYGDVAVAIS